MNEQARLPRDTETARAMRTVSISRISQFDAWCELADEWERLLQNCPRASFFLTWPWLYSWAQVFLGSNRKLFILACHEKGHLVGVAPLYLDEKKIGGFPVRELRFLGGPETGSDGLDVLAQKGCEKKIAVALYQYLTGEAQDLWDQLVLTDIPANSLFLQHFLNCFEADGKYAELQRSAFCPILPIPASEDELYAGLSPSWRKKFKQDMRVSQRDYSLEHRTCIGAAVQGELDGFFGLYEEKGGWPSQTLKAILREFFNHWGGSPPLQLDTLVVEDKPVAALVHFRYRGVLSMYLMAVDKVFNPKISFGNLLVGRVIISAIGTDILEYDFLKGIEAYKFHWANEGQATLQLKFRQKSTGALLGAIGQSCRNMGKVLLR